MGRIIILTILILLWSMTVRPQFFNKLRYGIESGVGISIGPSTFANFNSTINPLTVQYYFYKRYKLPMLRIRFFSLKEIDNYISVGLKAGIDVHYLEENEYGQKETNFSIPVQALGQIKTLSINKARALYFGINFGYDFKNLSHYPYKEKGGRVLSVEIISNKTKAVERHLYYKAGFEYEKEKNFYFFQSTGSGYKNETVKTAQRRRQVYFSLGGYF